MHECASCNSSPFSTRIRFASSDFKGGSGISEGLGPNAGSLNPPSFPHVWLCLCCLGDVVLPKSQILPGRSLRFFPLRTHSLVLSLPARMCQGGSFSLGLSLRVSQRLHEHPWMSCRPSTVCIFLSCAGAVVQPFPGNVLPTSGSPGCSGHTVPNSAPLPSLVWTLHSHFVLCAPRPCQGRGAGGDPLDVKDKSQEPSAVKS